MNIDLKKIFDDILAMCEDNEILYNEIIEYMAEIEENYYFGLIGRK